MDKKSVPPDSDPHLLSYGPSFMYYTKKNCHSSLSSSHFNTHPPRHIYILALYRRQSCNVSATNHGGI